MIYKKCYPIFIIAIMFCSLSCKVENPLLPKYEKSYSELREKIIKNDAEIEKAFELVPPEITDKVRESKAKIIKYTLEDFLLNNRISEAGLVQMIEGASNFNQVVEESRDFNPTEQQRESYKKLREKFLQNKELFDRYISDAQSSKDAQTKAYGAIFKKIIDNPIDLFTKKILTNDEAFTKLINQYDESFDSMLEMIRFANLGNEMDKVFK